ncbi:hypothetical protein NDU88_010692 [Pleurodeles waltl]|uniref:Uncharacterized protein n=1 Tax=Pleurodeles waltl TaxID=8319 RepID=A0AAV7R0Y7_PLEWA|nr:hypothetical protein NDU88_010692 [Pleurodeles waltl]
METVEAARSKAGLLIGRVRCRSQPVTVSGKGKKAETGDSGDKRRWERTEGRGGGEKRHSRRSNLNGNVKILDDQGQK